MMSPIIIVLFLIAVTLFIFVSYKVSNTKKTVIPAEAGPTGKASLCTKNKFALNKYSTILNNGKPIPTDHLIPICINGTCMEEIGLNDGDICFAQKFPWWKNKAKLIKEGYLLLIHVPKPNDVGFQGYKIRIAESIDGDKVKTYYFDSEGNKCQSRYSHPIKNVKGIVVWKKK